MDKFKQNRSSYTSTLKLKAITFAENHGNRAAARKFNVCEKNIRRWKTNKEAVLICPRNKRAFRKRICKFSDLENELKDWIVQLRAQRNIVI